MIHFYYGDNDFAQKQHILLIKDQFSKKFGAENIVRLDSSDTDSVLTELVSVGLFAHSRLLLLDNVFSNKTLVEKLPTILPLMQAETELIITDSKPDKRTKLYKLLLEGKTREFILPKRMNQFVIDEAARQQVEIDKNAVEDLILYTAGDAWRISNEIAKFRASNKTITKDGVKKYVEPDLMVNVFQVLDDVFGHQTERAVGKIAALRQNEDPNAFFALLVSQVFALAAVVSSDKPDTAIAKDMGIHPFVISKMRRSARNINSDKMSYITKLVAEIDAKIKLSNKETAWDLIEAAVGKI